MKKAGNRGLHKVAYAVLAALIITQTVTTNAANAASGREQTLPLMQQAETNAALSGTAQPMRALTADEIVAEMGTGWNLGNTMDGHTGFTPSETAWQNVETTKELIRAVHDLGFNTIRIPVTWGTMIDDANGYAIDENWMGRVQDIVDYAVSQDMYVIVNIHHDGAEQTGWLRVASEDVDAVNEKFAAVWQQIAEVFKDYDEHLIFESMNEVKGPDDSAAEIKKDYERINELNQIFVDTVRATRSNNAQRWLSVPGRYTNIETTTDDANGFALPQDSAENRLFVAVHYYDYSFGLVESQGKTTWSYENALTLKEDFAKLADKFTSQGIPVIMGEYGCINKDNSEERAYHVEVVNRLCRQNGVVPVYWDQGWYDRSMSPDYSFTLIDRDTLEIVDKGVTDAIMRGFFVDGAADLSDIEKSPAVTEITGITSEKDALNLVIGTEADLIEQLGVQAEPEKQDDVILWKTMDESVATVYNGHILARGIGSTAVIAYSQSGSAEKTFTVTVYARAGETPAQTVSLSADGIELVRGKSTWISAVLEPQSSDAFVSYRSSNEAVASVSAEGKVVGKAGGFALIIATASSGAADLIPVTVRESEQTGKVSLALNVYFNDESAAYYSNESGQAIEVTGDGQYTVVFDCAADLSEAAKSAGVTGLNNLTSVYIKDDDVTKGNAKKTPLLSCNIRYDSVVVDGVSLTVNQTESKSALKSSGVLDTNDPLNSWDGSAVDEVAVSNHVLNITGIENPQRVEVTFTLSDLVFEGAGDETESTKVGFADKEPAEISMNENTRELTVETEKDGEICFVSSDTSVVSVDSRVMHTAAGTCTAVLHAMGNGTAEIMVYSEDGTESVSYPVTVSGVEIQKMEVRSAGETAESEAEGAETAAAGSRIDANTVIIIVCIVLVIGILAGLFVYKKKQRL